MLCPSVPILSGFWEYRFYAEGIPHEGGMPRQFSTRVFDSHDPGYMSTSRMVLEAAMW